MRRRMYRVELYVYTTLRPYALRKFQPYTQIEKSQSKLFDECALCSINLITNEVQSEIFRVVPSPWLWNLHFVFVCASRYNHQNDVLRYAFIAWNSSTYHHRKNKLNIHLHWYNITISNWYGRTNLQCFECTNVDHQLCCNFDLFCFVFPLFTRFCFICNVFFSRFDFLCKPLGQAWKLSVHNELLA